MSENYQYTDCNHCGQSLMEGQIHNCRQKLMNDNDNLKTALRMYETHMVAMQRDAETYLTPQHDTVVNMFKYKDVEWFVSVMLEHLDGPVQREIQSAAKAALADRP